jgi:F-type H+-transporting ATPase subunit delta
MSRRSDAREYARGLFSAAAGDDVHAVAAEMTAFDGLLAARDDLRTALTNPAVPVAQKVAVVGRVIDLAPPSALVRAFLLLVGRNDDYGLVADIVRELDARVRQHDRVVDAEVTTAVPLPDGRAQVIVGQLAETAGRQVRVTTRVDPSILGGVVTRVGSVVYDGSVKRQLERLRTQLEAGALAG